MAPKILPKKKIVLAITGGSGSGKTTLAKALQKKIGEANSILLFQDSYYFDQSNNFDHDGGRINFDHPDAIDFQLMAKHVNSLKQGQTVDVPIYNFITHSRKTECLHVSAKPVILLDGILILSQKIIRDLIDYSIFIDVPEQLRFERRLYRDTKERGRSEEGVREQFTKQVKPMHDTFVEPAKIYANYICSGTRNVEEEVDEILNQKKIQDYFLESGLSLNHKNNIKSAAIK